MIYFVEEVENQCQYARAEEIEADTFEEALKKAAKEQYFYGTMLLLGDEVDNNYICHVIAEKRGRGWKTADYYRRVPQGI